ncbi:MAG: SDR family oxidoreductase [Dehalococcoidia bacterium]|nr:SDR family oxidoreductase [Dehalococcoidia bacterium]
MGRLSGRIAMVTGGGRGIGQGISTVLAREGASIVIADIDLVNAERTAAELAAGGAATFVVHCDVSDAASAADAVSAAVSRFGRVDILVNNAGVVGSHLGAGATEDDWDVCYEVNVKGIWNMTRAAAPHFFESGGGRVVNIASIAGRKGTGGLPHYCASKAAAISITQSLAQELGPRNINVNAVCPGLLWTDMWRNLEGMIGANDTPEVVERRQIFERYLETNCPLRREQTPEDIGEAVAFLVSDAARNITGQSLNVDGGIEMN